MKKSKYTEEQIAFALRQTETGTSVQEVIRKMGISEQTFYNWKKKYGGLGVSELLNKNRATSLTLSFGGRALDTVALLVSPL